MAATSGRKSAPLIEELYHQGYRFDFFQAVRILERYFEQLAKENPKLARAPVGFDSQPDREIVRFRSLPSMSFPGNAITEIRRAKELDYIAPEDRPPAEMIVAFLGLTGPQGVLPRHYTALLMKRLQEKDPTLREFFDLFNHRTISLFYRAWEKYRFPLAAERRARSTTSFGEDLFSQALFCYVGMGTQGQQDRLEIPNDAFLFYSGLFATEHRSVQPLETLLGDYFQLPVAIEQFQGQWLYLDEEDLSRMPDRRLRQGVNAILGVSLVAGRRIWDVQSKFRVVVGPLSLAEFRRFFPPRSGSSGGDILRPFCQLIRMYVGVEYDFDVQPVLKAEEVPQFHLNSHASDGPRLGWTTWSRTQPAQRDVRDVCFFLDDNSGAR